MLNEKYILVLLSSEYAEQYKRHFIFKGNVNISYENIRLKYIES